MRTKIDIGQRITGSVEVLRGLAKDDVVVIAGQPKIRDGVPVKIATLDGRKDDMAATTPAAAATAPATPSSSAVASPNTPKKL